MSRLGVFQKMRRENYQLEKAKKREDTKIDWLDRTRRCYSNVAF